MSSGLRLLPLSLGTAAAESDSVINGTEPPVPSPVSRRCKATGGLSGGSPSDRLLRKQGALPSGELRAAMVWVGKAEPSQRRGSGSGAVPAVMLVGAATSSTTSVRDRRQRQNRAARWRHRRAAMVDPEAR
nr:hypothetical protein Itr_chr01CG08280 [Ipomoea trifida]